MASQCVSLTCGILRGPSWRARRRGCRSVLSRTRRASTPACHRLRIWSGAASSYASFSSCQGVAIEGVSLNTFALLTKENAKEEVRCCRGALRPLTRRGNWNPPARPRYFTHARTPLCCKLEYLQASWGKVNTSLFLGLLNQLSRGFSDFLYWYRRISPIMDIPTISLSYDRSLAAEPHPAGRRERQGCPPAKSPRCPRRHQVRYDALPKPNTLNPKRP